MIVNVGGGVHAVLEADPTQLPPDHSATSDRADSAATAAPIPVSLPPPPHIKPLEEIERRKLDAKKITIDLMLLYTKKTASR
jgi:hypothetical protein